MTGQSVALDPRTHAVRRDIADIRLADRVFAPHYAAPMERMVVADASLMDEPGDGSTMIRTLGVGDRFEVLDIAGATAWGIAVCDGLVGYVPLTAIEGFAP